jgi:ADP-L-glycero-D-manno-heptose 6-epimerase
MIAVTGAAGFIGSNLAARLACMGHQLLLVDRLPLGPKATNLASLPPSRLMGPDAFLAFLAAGGEGIEAVFHLGACSRTTETDWSYLERNNVRYSQAVWSWCAARGKPLLYASSAATYGDGSLGFDDRTPPEKLRPLNLYGKSKNDFDAWALAESRSGRPTPPGWAGLKFFNVYGPNEGHKGPMASVVWHARRQIAESGEVRLFRSTEPAVADGCQRRDFVFVHDCVDHLLWLWRHPEVSGIHNSGTGEARTFLDLAHAVFASLGISPAVRFIDMPASLSGQYQSYTRADMSKLRSSGYDGPVTSLEDGVRATVQALRAAA